MKLGITMLMYNKGDIEFVTEFPCFLGHPVFSLFINVKTSKERQPHANEPQAVYEIFQGGNN